MSEMQPPSEGQPMPPAEPPQVPPAEWQQTPPQAPPTGPLPGPPEAKPRKKLVWWAFALGFVTPAVGTALALWLASATPYMTISALVGYGSMLAVVLAFIFGLVKSHDALRSYGIGGMVGIGVGMLIALLLFGACLVSLAGLSAPRPTGG